MHDLPLEEDFQPESSAFQMSTPQEDQMRDLSNSSVQVFLIS